jgi:hypothetical protein
MDVKLGLLIFTGILTCPPGAASAAEAVVFSYSVTSPITLHEPVFIRVSISNGLPEQISLDLGKERKSKLLFSITQPDGLTASPPAIPETGFGAQGRVSVPPDERYTQTVVLNEWYQPGQVGRYQIRVRLPAEIRTESGRKIDTSSDGTLSLEIRPRSAQTLERQCERLARSALDQTSGSKAAEAALALAYVEDPICVQYLGNVAEENGPFTQTAIQGLARIANIYGIDLVMSELHTSNPELKSSIENALKNLRQGVTLED